jgi:HlyD family secretion protein
MKRTLYTLVLAAAIVGAWYGGRRSQAAVVMPVQAAGPAAIRLIAAAGRVEPLSEELKIGSELDGRLRRVPVEEGQSVHAGQVIAELDNGDYQARVAINRATLQEREAALERLVNGSRHQERGEAAAQVREAEVVLDNARIERDRRQNLLERGAISRTEFDSVDRDYRIAKAKLDAVHERRALVDDQTRPEDIARAKADVEAAKARLAEAESLLAKTIIRSPIDAVVFRKKLKAGESVSSKGDPPIITLGNVSRLRVRVDVDENDVARLQLGQAGWVTAPAYGDRKFTGKVVEIGRILGRKNIRTDEPSERVDTKILETLLELDAGQPLPIGLRVDAYIRPN